ncbi:MAG: tRNA (adenosine(37)-N6)-dimethylallyltransferase MiaA [Candidatus Paceibacterota bacterium]|jgi:tRNA dimethylallyltransferase
MSTLKPLIVILGPTASGKSEMALKLAKKYDGEIINADSRQVYKEMVIGTGSPAQIENENIKNKSDNAKVKNRSFQPITLNNIPHHLFHFVSPKKSFSVAEYKRSAIKMIRNIHKKNKLPILVGGTGLYIRAIVDNLNIPKAPPNDKIRIALEKRSTEKLFSMLNKIDPRSASVIGRHNKRKLIRALEVYKITGKPFSSQQIKGDQLFNVLEIGVSINRDKLYKKIDLRVDNMIENGLIDETKHLIKKYSVKLPAMTGIGYKEIGQYLSGELALPEASQRIKFRTHQYARRQMTWFKRDDRIRWIGNFSETKKYIDEFLLNANCKIKKSK